MRRLISTCFLLAALFADSTWGGFTNNRLRYRGGTIQARTSAYDWNATLTVDDYSLVIVISPRHTLRLKHSQVISISGGRQARDKVSAVATQAMPAAPPGLFGLMQKASDNLIGIVYQTEDGKQGAVLLECDASVHWSFLRLLQGVTGKGAE